MEERKMAPMPALSQFQFISADTKTCHIVIITHSVDDNTRVNLIHLFKQRYKEDFDELLENAIFFTRGQKDDTITPEMIDFWKSISPKGKGKFYKCSAVNALDSDTLNNESATDHMISLVNHLNSCINNKSCKMVIMYISPYLADCICYQLVFKRISHEYSPKGIPFKGPTSTYGAIRHSRQAVTLLTTLSQKRYQLDLLNWSSNPFVDIEATAFKPRPPHSLRTVTGKP